MSNKPKNKSDLSGILPPNVNPEYNPLIIPGAKKLKLKQNQKGIAKQNLTNKSDRLRFQEMKPKKMKIDRQIIVNMRELWFRKRRTEHDKPYLGDYYAQAIAEYLERNQIPKTVPKRERQTTKVMLVDQAHNDMQSLEKIARKRGQTWNTILENALLEYLEKPENYLGINFRRHEKIEKMG
jgi:hypothetical protein